MDYHSSGTVTADTIISTMKPDALTIALEDFTRMCDAAHERAVAAAVRSCTDR